MRSPTLDLRMKNARTVYVSPWLLFAGVSGLLGLAYYVNQKSAAAASGPIVAPGASPDWVKQIREMARPVEQAAKWPGLGDFLAVVAYTESRGDPNAGPDTSDNAARGWFGLRPDTAFAGEFEGANPSLLNDPRWSMAFAIWLAYRLRNYASPGQNINWLALRRGWALPELVDDVQEREQRSREVRDRMLDAVERVPGTPRGLPYVSAFPVQFDWPGHERVFQILRVA